jgi:hypothetical protein
LTPTKEEIVRRALEQYHKNNPYILTNPEESELRESGYLIAAQQELMYENNRHNSYTEQFSDLDKLDFTQPLEQQQPQFEAKPFTVDTVELMRTGVFVTGTRQSGKTNLVKLIVQRLLSEGKIVYIIDPTQAWQSDFNHLPLIEVTEPQGRQTLTWKVTTTIFDTSQLTPLWQQKFVEVFNTVVFMRAVETPKLLRPQIIVVYEESHTAMENNRLNGKAYQNTKRILTQGANYEISFLGITQFPALVDKLPVKAAQQRYFGKTSEPNDMKYLKAYLGETVQALPSLKLGEFFYMHSGRLSKIQTPKFQLNETVFNYAMSMENRNTEGCLTTIVLFILLFVAQV